MTETTTSTGKTTRAQRLAMPLAREVVRDLAVEHGACIRPIQLRRTNLDTGEVDTVLVPCGNTLASVCPACAERAKTLRAAQCREGWHLEDEPDLDPDPATDDQKWWITQRAEAQQARDLAAAAGQDTDRPGRADHRTGRPDHQLRRPRQSRPGQARTAAPLHPPPPGRPGPAQAARSAPRTVGKTYTAPDGKTFRPSLFVTLTCPSYGRVGEDGAPADPQSYDYDQAARDALAFAALFDRFIQNLRRYLGYDLQYFAAIEPQRRLAPHVHIAMRGTVSRAEIRRVLAATYHQVWWPDTSAVKYDGDQLPVWDEHTGTTWTRLPGKSCPPGTRPSTSSATSRTTWPGSVSVRRPGRARRKQGRGPVHRLPDQVPDQAGRRLPSRRDRRAAGACGPAG